ncbi:MAG: hydrogenase maturation protease [Ignavibacteria bacterium]|nr:hydrogenase maturation protease [Ignavibacteria bacterium]
MNTAACPKRPSIIVIGLGNEFISDDGVGIWVVRELKKRLSTTDIAFEELSVGGLQLLDYLVGYEQCIIVDAVVTGIRPPGTIYRFVQAAGDKPIRLTSSHQIDLSQTIELARLLQADIPQTITVYGIEASDTTTFNDHCTESVTQAIPQLVRLICRDLLKHETDDKSRCVSAFESMTSNCVGEWEVIIC